MKTEPRQRWWAFVLAASLGTSLLFKSLVGVVFPVCAALIYLGITRQLFHAKVWKALHPLSGLLVILLIAAPWHILADAAQSSVFRFHHAQRSRRISRLPVVLFHQRATAAVPEHALSARLRHRPAPLLLGVPSAVAVSLERVSSRQCAKLSFKPLDRAGKARLLALCWTGFILVFFTFSTTQEYYSMPCYPALALLLGSAMAAGGNWIRYGTRVLCGIFIAAAAAVLTLYFLAWNLPTPGDISAALSSNPGAYKLSLGHMEDLTIASFAYLRLPLLVAAVAFSGGSGRHLAATGQRAFLAIALMAILFFQAARIAMAAFDPYLSSRPLAEALLRSPAGKADRGSSLLHVFVDLLLHQSRRAAAQWPIQ